MRKKLHDEIKKYLKDYPKELREEKALTQNMMSEHLLMDERSYKYLEHGESGFSLETFLLLLWEIGERKFDIIDDLMTIIKNTKSKPDN